MRTPPIAAYHGGRPSKKVSELSPETFILLLFHAVLAPATAIHALLYKREPRGAFGWIAVCVVAPVAGPVLYLFFGVNRTRSRAQRFSMPPLRSGERGQAVSHLHPLPEDLPEAFTELARSGRALSRHALVGGNRVEPLFNGEQAYPAMLEAIEAARDHICLTTYILDQDETGQDFCRALAAAVARGVDVRVLIDGVGEWYSRPRAGHRLRKAGVRTARFLPPGLLPPSLSINLRNHHKILVVDDRVGFTGGMNISDRHCVDKPGKARPTADVHFRLRGPVVGQLALEFYRTWEFATGEIVRYRPTVETGHDEVICRTLTDGPDEDLDRMTMLLSAAIASARHSIRIMTPYFLPPRELIGALQAAAVRGIDVHVVLPAKSNLRFVDWATRNMLWEMLFRGVRVSLQPAPFNHGKLFVVDDFYSLVGSANWDPRSLRLNFELQVEAYDATLAGHLSERIDAAAAAGRELRLDEVDGRSLPARLRDSACWLFSPYL
ncbi:MAG: phospholipase D-like domain-containing protein [Wenzhouxiangella sp.]|jgi:cardiolipin synthase|nr:phospholipase D-like domain-containing protein [Wenzhouxiangella sp.]